MTDLLYSFVVDGAPKFRHQAWIFLRTLLATGVQAKRIHAHLTHSARAQNDLVEMLVAHNVVLHDLDPFLDGEYCNKLVQIDALPLNDAACVALCDTDLAFLSGLEAAASADVVRAKPVDLPNPPIAFLEQAREICGITNVPRVVRTSCGDSLTWASNCNGGVYLLPSALAPTIAASWKKHAITLYAARQFLEDYERNIDQISFAMAMLDLGIDVDELPIEDNFPLHLSEFFLSDDDIHPRVLHFHWLYNQEYLLTTGNSALDRAVNKVNCLTCPSKDPSI